MTGRFHQLARLRRQPQRRLKAHERNVESHRSQRRRSNSSNGVRHQSLNLCLILAIQPCHSWIGLLYRKSRVFSNCLKPAAPGQDFRKLGPAVFDGFSSIVDARL
jgi:hypothetical protein